MEMTAPDMRLGYTQLNQLRDGLSQARASEGNGRDSQAELEQAAQQFESIFINMWLKSAREANQVFAENNITNSSEMVMQQEMLDHEMAVHMSRNGGIGLAPVIVRQLGGDPDQMSTPSPAAVSTPRVEHNIAPRGISAQVGAQQDGAQQEQAQRQSAFASPEDFVRALKPVVERALQNLPVSVTAVVGQAALETGWGSQVIAAADGTLSHNLFGMKAKSPQEPSVAITSQEFEHGRWLAREDHFRQYADWQNSVEDYLRTISESPRYQQAMNVAADPAAYAQALQDAGYATDPQYASKLQAVVASVQQTISRLGL